MERHIVASIGEVQTLRITCKTCNAVGLFKPKEPINAPPRVCDCHWPSGMGQLVQFCNVLIGSKDYSFTIGLELPED